jgi:hypothetical protein
MTDLRQRIVDAMLEANCREGGHADIYQLADAVLEAITPQSATQAPRNSAAEPAPTPENR